MIIDLSSYELTMQKVNERKRHTERQNAIEKIKESRLHHNDKHDLVIMVQREQCTPEWSLKMMNSIISSFPWYGR